MEDSLKAKIISFVAEERAESAERVSLTTRLFEDLGLDGDDAVEFFEKYQGEFDVDLSSMEWDRHFGPEGCNPFALLFVVLGMGSKNQRPVTVQHLVDFARAGRWDYNYDT